MNEMKVHHVGYLVKNIEKAKKAFCGTLGFEELSAVVRDEGRKADICFLQSGTFVVELVSPYSGDSVAGGDLFKRFKNAPTTFAWKQTISTLTSKESARVASCKSTSRNLHPQSAAGVLSSLQARLSG